MPSPSLLCSMIALASFALVCGCRGETTADKNHLKGDAHEKQPQVTDVDTSASPAGASASPAGASAMVLGQELEAGLSPVPTKPVEQDYTTNANSTVSISGKLQEDAINALDSGDLVEAFELVRELNRVDGENPQAIFLMARVLAEKHRFRSAVNMLDDLAIEFPDAKLAVLGQTAEWLVFQGDWEAAEERCRILISFLDETSLVDRLLSRLLMRQGRRLEAEFFLRRLCRVGNVEEMDLRSLLSLSYPLRGDAATDAFEPIGLEGDARHAISMGDFAAADEMLQQALERTPNGISPAEYALHGRLLAILEQFDRLPEWIKNAPAGIATHSDYWFALGVHQLQQSDFSAAVKSFGRTVIRDQTDFRAYEKLGDALTRIGKSELAKVATERADLIEQTVSIGDEMASNPQRDVQKISVLIDLLERLQRPLEALGWRGIQVAYGRANSMLDEDAARDVLQMINQKRIAQLGNTESPAKRLFVTCGIELPAEPD
jgi:Flp pilus assembly protein TadD